MGTMKTIALVEQYKAGKIGLKKALSIHLFKNHYPPVSKQWLPIVLSIIERCATDKNLEYKIQNPLQKEKITAQEIVECLHLELFLPGVEFSIEIMKGSPLYEPELN